MRLCAYFYDKTFIMREHCEGLFKFRKKQSESEKKLLAKKLNFAKISLVKLKFLNFCARVARHIPGRLCSGLPPEVY